MNITFNSSDYFPFSESSLELYRSTLSISVITVLVVHIESTLRKSGKLWEFHPIIDREALAEKHETFIFIFPLSSRFPFIYLFISS
jgi:hypothetical protein